MNRTGDEGWVQEYESGKKWQAFCLMSKISGAPKWTYLFKQSRTLFFLNHFLRKTNENFV